MQPFPTEWKDNPRNRKRWDQLQRNGAFLRQELERQGSLQCHYCQKVVRLVHWSENYNGDDIATVDHVIPISRGGTDLPSNLVVACRPCNLRKGSN